VTPVAAVHVDVVVHVATGVFISCSPDWVVNPHEIVVESPVYALPVPESTVQVSTALFGLTSSIL